MSSNDKTSDLLVATTRATKDETATDATAAEAKPAAEVSAERPAVKKRAPVRKAAQKKVAAKSQKKVAVSSFTFGRRVWPD